MWLWRMRTRGGRGVGVRVIRVDGGGERVEGTRKWIDEEIERKMFGVSYSHFVWRGIGMVLALHLDLSSVLVFAPAHSSGQPPNIPQATGISFR